MRKGVGHETYLSFEEGHFHIRTMTEYEEAPPKTILSSSVVGGIQPPHDNIEISIVSLVHCIYDHNRQSHLHLKDSHHFHFHLV